MKVADLPILFYAIDATSSGHGKASRWLEQAIDGPDPLGLAWPTVHSFLRLGTSAAFPGSMTDDEALGWVSEWLDAGARLATDDGVDWRLFALLLDASRRDLRNAVDDAHLAAVALSSGATLASFDRDFEVFVPLGLRFERLGG